MGRPVFTKLTYLFWKGASRAQLGYNDMFSDSDQKKKKTMPRDTAVWTVVLLPVVVFLVSPQPWGPQLTAARPGTRGSQRPTIPQASAQWSQLQSSSSSFSEGERCGFALG